LVLVDAVVRWSGREARALREAKRMSVREFAAHLGVNDAAVSNWERRGELARLRYQTQQILDVDLARSDKDVQERFKLILLAGRTATADPHISAERSADQHSCPELGVNEAAADTTRTAIAARRAAQPVLDVYDMPDDGPVRPTRGLSQAQRADPDSGIGAPTAAEIDDMDRRELLRLVSIAGALQVVSPIDTHLLGGTGSSRPAGLDAETLDGYGSLNTHLWRVFVLSRSKAAAFPLVREQLDVLVGHLQRTASQLRTRQRLYALTADLLQLAGEIFFDRNLYTDAAHCYALAGTASREAGDADLWACALVRQAFINIYEREFAKAAPMLDAAAGLARNGDSALSTRYWVSAVQAQTYAGLGDFDSCERALGAAEGVHTLSGAVHNGGWLRFDGSRLPEERGTCYLELHRPALAEQALTHALRGGLTARRRGSVLADLAVLSAQRRDLDQLVAYAAAAIDLVRRTGSGVVGRKLLTLQAQLTPLLGDDQVRVLDEEIAVLASGK
jgi:transcriptional regulator with XRE-family HTH domain/tetratricopeptide (TPR) repeat protein